MTRGFYLTAEGAAECHRILGISISTEAPSAPVVDVTVAPSLPGHGDCSPAGAIPVSFGFDNWRPSGGNGLSREAQQRVDDKIASVQEALRHAMESAHTYVVGGAA